MIIYNKPKQEDLFFMTGTYSYTNEADFLTKWALFIGGFKLDSTEQFILNDYFIGASNSKLIIDDVDYNHPFAYITDTFGPWNGYCYSTYQSGNEFHLKYTEFNPILLVKELSSSYTIVFVVNWHIYSGQNFIDHYFNFATTLLYYSGSGGTYDYEMTITIIKNDTDDYDITLYHPVLGTDTITGKTKAQLILALECDTSNNGAMGYSTTWLKSITCYSGAKFLYTTVL